MLLLTNEAISFNTVGNVDQERRHKKQFLFANKRNNICYHSRKNAISNVRILNGFFNLDTDEAVFVGAVRKI